MQTSPHAHNHGPHTSPEGRGGPPTTSSRMREECWDLHKSAEAGRIARAMIEGTLTREHYIDMLGQIRRGQGARRARGGGAVAGAGDRGAGG